MQALTYLKYKVLRLLIFNCAGPIKSAEGAVRAEWIDKWGEKDYAGTPLLWGRSNRSSGGMY